MLVVAEQCGIKTKPLDNFWLSPAQRDVLLLIPGLSKTIKKKLAKEKPSCSVAEVASMLFAVIDDFLEGEPMKQVALLFVAKHLMDRLQEGVMAMAKPLAKTKTKRRSQSKPAALYQFKITLLESDPPIWRRIQVKDCTLDKLHEHIQTAMGWTNSHLHDFKIDGERYGDPMLLGNGVGESQCVDSTKTLLSDILPKTRKRFAFEYEYDFGDGWEHEVLFEETPPVDPKAKYPLCVEGERACPPEDCGGVWGYGDILEIIANPNQEEHKSVLEWIGSSFDPQNFDPKKATKRMRKGLPDWRQHL